MSSINSMTLLPVNLVMVFQISVCESPDSASGCGTRWTSEKLERHETGTIATIIGQASSNHWKTIQLQHFISKPLKVLFFFFCKNHLQNPSPTSVLECLSPNLSYSLVGRKKSIPGFSFPNYPRFQNKSPDSLLPWIPQGGWSHGHPLLETTMKFTFSFLSPLPASTEKKNRMFQSDSKIDPLVYLTHRHEKTNTPRWWFQPSWKIWIKLEIFPKWGWT